MRASDVGLGSLARIWLLVPFGLSCNAPSPTPTKVEDPAALVAPPTREKHDTPFIDPNTDSPGPRRPGQLEPAELTAALAAAETALQGGDLGTAVTELQRCLNREPRSGACEALFAATMLEQRKQKAYARHFLHEAVAADDPAVPDALWRKLATLAANNGRFDDAASALTLLVARGSATADDYTALARALQADEGRKAQAIDALEKAQALAPTRHELLLERAVLLTQTGDRPGAIALLEQYKAAVAGNAEQVALAEARIAALRAEQPAGGKTPI